MDSDSRGDSDGTHAVLRTSTPTIIYVLNLLSLAVGVTAVVALVWAYLARSDLEGTWAESHLTWSIRTFWLGLLSAVVYTLVAAVLSVIPFLGWAVISLLALWLAVWWIVRNVKGLLHAGKQQPISNPRSWLF